MAFKTSICKCGTTGFILLAGLLMSLTGCVNHDRPNAESVYSEEPGIDTQSYGAK